MINKNENVFKIFKALVETTDHPILIIDNQGVIVFANYQMEVQLNKTSGQIIGKHITTVLFSGTRQNESGKIVSILLETLNSGRNFFGETMLVSSSNLTPKKYLIDAKTIRDSNDRILGAYSIYTELLEVREVTQQFINTIETVYSFAEAIGARDVYTVGHSERVAEYSKLIAEKMGLSNKEIEEVYFAGLIHDIGKIGVPEEILNKAAKLTDDEFNVIKKHPSCGAQILSHISNLENIVAIMLHHHEKYDGSGYPYGLKGNAIPLLSRIIAVADAFEAMISNRSYRKALSYEKAIDQLKSNIGSQFDPEVVDVFLSLLEELYGSAIKTF